MYDSWKQDGLRYICTRCKQKYYEVDGGCESCSPCVSCGALCDIDNDECDVCSKMCGICNEEAGTTEYNGSLYCNDCMTEIEKILSTVEPAWK